MPVQAIYTALRLLRSAMVFDLYGAQNGAQSFEVHPFSETDFLGTLAINLGHFSRTELVRSFVRGNGDRLPTVYEIRISGGE